MQVQFLSEQVDSLLYAASGPSLLAWCLEHPVPVSSSGGPSVETLLVALRLSPLQEAALCLALVAAADRPDIRNEDT